MDDGDRGDPRPPCDEVTLWWGILAWPVLLVMDGLELTRNLRVLFPREEP